MTNTLVAVNQWICDFGIFIKNGNKGYMSNQIKLIGGKEKMKKIILLTLIMIPFILGISTSTIAFDGHYDHHKPKFSKILNFFNKHKDELELSREQVDKLKSIRNAFMRDTAKATVELRIAWEELLDLLKENKIDTPRAEAKIKHIATLGSELGINFVKAFAQQKEILTKDQLEKAKELRKKLYKERHKKFPSRTH